MDAINPKTHREAVALFRLQVLGAVPRQELPHGQLRAELRALSQQRFLPPGTDVPRRYSVTTLERWFYALRRRGLAGLAPRQRSDEGRARALSAEQRDLLLAIRREYPHASVPLILATLCRDGRLQSGIISHATVRRFFAANGLDRLAGTHADARIRHRWQAEAPNTLWHADVCHGTDIERGGRKRPLRIHAILDDASRFIVGVRISHHEREVDMLHLLTQAWRSWGRSELLYLDNGATYRGDTLATACGRVGTTLLHARPYDPQARGKMERFWRTLRQGCLNHLGPLTDLTQVHDRVLAFITQHYHKAAHAALMGRCPAAVWATRNVHTLTESEMAEALQVQATRYVRNDCTLSIGGVVWETEQGFLAGRKVMVTRTLLDTHAAPTIEYDGKRYPLVLANPKVNAHRRRKQVAVQRQTGIDVPFDPVGVLLPTAEKVADNDSQGGAR